MLDHREDPMLREVFAARHRALAEALPAEGEPLTEAAEQKIIRLLSRRKQLLYPLFNTAMKRVACIAVAVLLVGSAVTVGVSSMQNRDTDIWVDTYEGGATIRFRADEPVPFFAKYPTYLPAGYTLVRDQSEADETYLLYEGEGSDFFCFAQYPSGDGACLNIGMKSYEKVTVAAEYEGLYIQNGEYTCLVFTEGNYMYLLNGTLPREELFKVAGSILK